MQRVFQIHVCDPNTGAESVIAINASSFPEAQRIAQAQGWLIGSGVPTSTVIEIAPIVGDTVLNSMATEPQPTPTPPGVPSAMNPTDAAIQAIARSPLIRMPVEVLVGSMFGVVALCFLFWVGLQWAKAITLEGLIFPLAFIVVSLYIPARCLYLVAKANRELQASFRDFDDRRAPRE
jgi:hypothetical protein